MVQPLRRRVKRDQRVRLSRSFIATERDLEIIQAVYRYRVLTLTQIQQLFFGHRTAAQRRLRKLFDAGLLDRRFEHKYSKQNTPAFYVLDGSGATLLRRSWGETIAWTPEHKKVTTTFLKHMLDQNTVQIAVHLACKQQRCSLVRWIGERDLKKLYLSQQTRENIVIPDGFFELQTADGKQAFCFEMDEGTESFPAKFARKIRAYEQEYRSGTYQRRFGTRSLRVLVVTTSQRRAANLKHKIEQSGGARRYWFTSLDRITSKSVLHEPIWSVASLEGDRPLLEALGA
jgi:hypothetical protein